MEKVRMRQERRQGFFAVSYRVWVAHYKGHKAEAICPVWAYAEVLEKARKGS